MRTPINVMLDIDAFMTLKRMVDASGKTRTAILRELIMGTRQARDIGQIVQDWFDSREGVDQDDVAELISLLT